MIVRWLVARRRALIALVLVGALIIGLHSLSTLGLRGPAGLDRVALEEWTADPIVALATVLRWASLVMAYYLLAVVVAVLALADNLDASPLRYVIPSRIAGTLGLLLGLGAVAVPLAAQVDRSPNSEVAVDEPRLTLTEVEAPPTLERIDAVDDPPHVVAPESGRSPSGQPSAATTIVDGGGPDALWVVEPGDSFWTIAEEQLIEAWRTKDVSDSEIADYWRTLIAANSDRLVEAGNPDLLYPGQALELPKIPKR